MKSLSTWLYNTLYITPKTLIMKSFTFSRHHIKRALYFQKHFSQLREPKKLITGSPFKNCTHHVLNAFRAHNIDPIFLTLDPAEYQNFLQKALIFREQYIPYSGMAYYEKSLEHFLAAKLLDFHSEDVFIDIASCYSPACQIYSQFYGCRCYEQDLQYPPGIYNNTIGGDASHMPVPDGFATKMALHCSFEHFEGNSDIEFIKEAGRVLAPGGKLCIIPLYLSDEYFILTDPTVWKRPDAVTFEEGTPVHCFAGWNERHGRLYDVPHFIDRIVKNLGPLQLKIFFVTNEKSMHPSCYTKFLALFEKPL